MNTPPAKLTIRITWLGILNYLGALLTTGWMLYLLYTQNGYPHALLALLLSGVVLRFGASPLLVIASGVLYFHFDAAGVWLPLAALLAAGAAFVKDLQSFRDRQKNDPAQSGE